MIKKLVVMLFALSLLLLPASASGDDVGGVADSLLPTEAPAAVDAGDMALVETSLLSVAPITPTNTTGLTSLVLSLIGNYDPVVAEHRYENYNGSYSYVREIQPDYPWLVSAGIFALVLWCSLRILGGVICKK